MSTLQSLIEKIEDCGIPRRTLMRSAGLDYDAFNSWKNGKRTPRASSLRKIAAALRGYASNQSKLADELERLAG
jgi:hypothetical protein